MENEQKPEHEKTQSLVELLNSISHGDSPFLKKRLADDWLAANWPKQAIITETRKQVTSNLTEFLAEVYGTNRATFIKEDFLRSGAPDTLAFKFMERHWPKQEPLLGWEEARERIKESLCHSFGQFYPNHPDSETEIMRAADALLSILQRLKPQETTYNTVPLGKIGLCNYRLRGGIVEADSSIYGDGWYESMDFYMPAGKNRLGIIRAILAAFSITDADLDAIRPQPTPVQPVKVTDKLLGELCSTVYDSIVFDKPGSPMTIKRLRVVADAAYPKLKALLAGLHAKSAEAEATPPKPLPTFGEFQKISRGIFSLLDVEADKKLTLQREWYDWCRKHFAGATEKPLRKRIAELEKKTISEFERGVIEGKSCQAILKIQGRERFVEELHKKFGGTNKDATEQRSRAEEHEKRLAHYDGLIKCATCDGLFEPREMDLNNASETCSTLSCIRCTKDDEVSQPLLKALAANALYAKQLGMIREVLKTQCCTHTAQINKILAGEPEAEKKGSLYQGKWYKWKFDNTSGVMFIHWLGKGNFKEYKTEGTSDTYFEASYDPSQSPAFWDVLPGPPDAVLAAQKAGEK